jgi:hypothetical protein
MTPAGSLADRIKQRREALENQTTTVLELPGYEDMLAVEFRLLGWQLQRKIAERHVRIKDKAIRELYTAADTLLTAQIGTYEITESGEQKPISDDWFGLCARAGISLRDDTTLRQAMIALLTDSGVTSLVIEWNEWAENRGKDVGDDVVRGFARSGSPS